MNSPAKIELNSIGERIVLQRRGYWPTDLTRELTAWLFVQALGEVRCSRFLPCRYRVA